MKNGRDAVLGRCVLLLVVDVFLCIVVHALPPALAPAWIGEKLAQAAMVLVAVIFLLQPSPRKRASGFDVMDPVRVSARDSAEHAPGDDH